MSNKFPVKFVSVKIRLRKQDWQRVTLLAGKESRRAEAQISWIVRKYLDELKDYDIETDTGKWQDFHLTEMGKVLEALKGIGGKNRIRGAYAKGVLDGTISELYSIVNGDIRIENVGERTKARIKNALSDNSEGDNR